MRFYKVILKRIKFKLPLVIIILIPTTLIGQNEFDINKKSILLEKEKVYDIMSSVSIYEDKSTTLTISDVSSMEFQENKKGIINFGILNSNFWIKLKIKNNSIYSISNWFFIIEFPQLDKVTFYFPKKDNSYIERIIGDTLPFYQREITSRFLNQRIPEEVDLNSDIYINIQSATSKTLPIFISTEKAFRDKDHLHQFILGCYFGVLFLVVVYNFFLYLSIKEKVYLYYVLFAFFIILYISAFLGFGYEYLWPENPFIQSKMILCSASMMLYFLVMFSIHFLDLKVYSINAYQAIKKSLIILPSLFLIVLFSNSIFLNKVISAIGFIYSFMLPILGIYVWRKGNHAARLFLVAWVPFFIAVNLFVLKTFGFIDKYSLEINYSIQFANAVEAVLFSFALADRVNLLKEQKYRAEEQIRINLEKSNSELEQKVKERTHELNETLVSIREDLNFAKRIQKRLLPRDVEKIEKLRIISRYLPMDEVGGDFFDITKLDGNVVRILIADATGHGVQAALITMLIKSEYEGLKHVMESPAKLLHMMNRLFLTKYIHLDTFFSCFIIDIDLEKETLCYASAGHPGQIFISDKKIETLKKTGMVIGVLKKTDFLETTIPFQKKDRLLLFTDGLVEEFNFSDEEYGEFKLSEFVSEFNLLELQLLIDKTLQNLNGFLNGKPIQDDITVIGVEWT